MHVSFWQIKDLIQSSIGSRYSNCITSVCSLLCHSSRIRLSPLKEKTRFIDDMAMNAVERKSKRGKKTLFKKSFSAQEFVAETIVSWNASCRCHQYFFLNGPIPASFVLILFFSCNNFKNTNWKKRRWCAWYSNLGLQDGKRRQNHGAMTATTRCPQC